MSHRHAKIFQARSSTPNLHRSASTNLRISQPSADEVPVNLISRDMGMFWGDLGWCFRRLGEGPPLKPPRLGLFDTRKLDKHEKLPLSDSFVLCSSSLLPWLLPPRAATSSRPRVVCLHHFAHLATFAHSHIRLGHLGTRANRGNSCFALLCSALLCLDLSRPVSRLEGRRRIKRLQLPGGRLFQDHFAFHGLLVRLSTNSLWRCHTLTTAYSAS